MRIFKQWVVAIALYVAMILDGCLAAVLHQTMSYGNSRASLLLLPIAVMVVAFEDDRNAKEVWLALAVGVIADLYFYGIIGVYAVGLPVMSAFGRWYSRVFPELFIFRLIGLLLMTSAFSAYVWLIFRLIGWTHSSLGQAGMSILYTAGWSALLTVLTYWIWAKLARNYPFLVDLDNYRY